MLVEMQPVPATHIRARSKHPAFQHRQVHRTASSISSAGLTGSKMLDTDAYDCCICTTCPMCSMLRQAMPCSRAIRSCSSARTPASLFRYPGRHLAAFVGREKRRQVAGDAPRASQSLAEIRHLRLLKAVIHDAGRDIHAVQHIADVVQDSRRDFRPPGFARGRQQLLLKLLALGFGGLGGLALLLELLAGSLPSRRDAAFRR